MGRAREEARAAGNCIPASMRSLVFPCFHIQSVSPLQQFSLGRAGEHDEGLRTATPGVGVKFS
jgi:hypothetical protein